MNMTHSVLALALLAAPAFADAPHGIDRGGVLDRVQDRIDRRESYVDRQTDNGVLDRVEDRNDRREDIADRRGFAGNRQVDRHERRSWWRLAH